MIDRMMRLLLICFATVLIVSPAMGAEMDRGDDDDKRKKAIPEDVIPGWVIVKFENGYAISNSASKTGLSAVDRVAERFEVKSVQKMFPMLDAMSAGKKASLKGMERLTNVFKMEIDEAMNPFVVASALQALPEVEYAEPMFKFKIDQHMAEPSLLDMLRDKTPLLVTPNDALFNQQSHLPHISAPEAWDIVKGEEGDIVISILDGGTEWQHEDLQGNVFINTAETPNNGVDDDNNGLVDDVNGWNFPADSNDPTGDVAATPLNAGHGTATAGIVSAITNNATGIAGLSWNSKVLPVNISCPDDDRALCFSYQGLVYSFLMEVDIVSASFGSDRPSSLIRGIVETLYENGTLVVASSGNAGTNNDLIPQYPANYDNVLSVGWTGKTSDNIHPSSNYGVSVDVYAPGSSINGTTTNNQYVGNLNGTSFSAPLAAALAGLVMVQNPEWSVDQVREQVRVTADDIRASNTQTIYRNSIGKGRINAFRALTEASPSVRIQSAVLRNASGSSRIGPGEGATLAVELTNYLEPISGLSVSLESDSDFITITTPTSNLAALGTGETAPVEFSLFASPDAPFNEPVALRLEMEDGGTYTDNDIFSVVVNNTNHFTEEIEFTLYQDGNLGYEGFQGETRGSGFKYKGVDYLFEGGLIMGRSLGSISDNIRGTSGFNQDDDFVRVEGSEFGIDNGRVTTEEGRLDLLDSDALNPNNIRVRLDSYADTSDTYNDFVILRYTIENADISQLDNFHMGLFFDWDSPTDASVDNAAYDAARSMGIFQDGSSGVYIGTKMLSDDATVNYRSIDNVTEIYDGFTDGEKFQFMSSGVQTTTLTGTDVSTFMSGGPYTIPIGGSIEIAYAVVAGETLDELNTHADAAQQLWMDSIDGLSPNPVSNEDPEVGPAFAFALEEPYPNPVRTEAVIQYEVPTSGAVELKIHDILGREVRALVNESVRAGKHTLTWDARDNTGNELASGMYLVTLSAPSNGGIKTETKKIVVLR